MSFREPLQNHIKLNFRYIVPGPRRTSNPGFYFLTSRPSLAAASTTPHHQNSRNLGVFLHIQAERGGATSQTRTRTPDPLCGGLSQSQCPGTDPPRRCYVSALSTLRQCAPT